MIYSPLRRSSPSAQLIPKAPRFSPAIILNIALNLASSNAFRSLASLNATGHSVRDSTLSIMYETVMLDHCNNMQQLSEWIRGNKDLWHITK